jgi:hypothetical protein
MASVRRMHAGVVPPFQQERQRWTMDDIPYSEIDHNAVRDDTFLFHLVSAGSFIEITSELYTDNLVEYCAEDEEVVAWLRQGWQRDEVQHGTALRRYVETAWPDFDWERGYRSFFDEYSQICTMEGLAPSRSLEMVARCVVETATSSFYRLLADVASEPVLRRLAALISADEVNHYKHFYRYFRRFAERERPGRVAILRILLARTGATDSEDAAIAFKHVRLSSEPDTASAAEDYAAFRRTLLPLARQHYRYDAAVKMLLKPLGMGGRMSRMVLPPATAAARYLLFS